jgi:NADH dehydrogenase (ubiquinone) 1 alpha subcomplex subunit 10
MTKFVQNPKHDRAVLMQHHLYISKFMQYIRVLSHVLNTGQGAVLERSVYSDSVFVDAMLACGYMNKKETDIYYKWRSETLPILMKPHLVIYLDVPAATVENNLKKRGRGEEKAFTKQFLEAMEESYKFGYLKSITEHAELLVYDWSVPGDPEVVVEDIERVDFDRFGKHDSKMEDWRMKEEWDWCERRWDYTNPTNLFRHECTLTKFNFGQNPKLEMSGEDGMILDNVLDEVPQTKYAVGWNPELGDDVLLKYREPPYPAQK